MGLGIRGRMTRTTPPGRRAAATTFQALPRNQEDSVKVREVRRVRRAAGGWEAQREKEREREREKCGLPGW